MSERLTNKSVSQSVTAHTGKEVPSFCSVGRSVGKVPGTWSVLLYLVGTANVSLLHSKLLFIISLTD